MINCFGSQLEARRLSVPRFDSFSASLRVIFRLYEVVASVFYVLDSVDWCMGEQNSSVAGVSIGHPGGLEGMFGLARKKNENFEEHKLKVDTESFDIKESGG